MKTRVKILASGVPETRIKKVKAHFNETAFLPDTITSSDILETEFCFSLITSSLKLETNMIRQTKGFSHTSLTTHFLARVSFNEII